MLDGWKMERKEKRKRDRDLRGGIISHEEEEKRERERETGRGRGRRLETDVDRRRRSRSGSKWFVGGVKEGTRGIHRWNMVIGFEQGYDYGSDRECRYCIVSGRAPWTCV